jgi:hypothetical protein
LSDFSENEELIKLFSEKYSLENPPSYELMGKILKYKFGNFPFAKKLHEKALTIHSPSYN